MPISYTIDRSRRLIRTRCYGLVTLAEVLDHFHVLKSDPDCAANLDVYLDLRDMASSPTAEQIREASGGPEILRGIVRFGCCAVVADRDAIYGMARMWEVLVEKSFTSVMVFRSDEEAEAWLTLCRMRNESDPD